LPNNEKGFGEKKIFSHERGIGKSFRNYDKAPNFIGTEDTPFIVPIA